MNILLADDSDDMRRLFGLVFRMASHTVHLVENGAEAVAAIEKRPFDVIILDLHMPVMDGWTALRRIRQLPNGKAVCIAVMSAVYDRVDMGSAIEKGADAVFSKPLAPSVILKKLEEMVSLGHQVNHDE